VNFQKAMQKVRNITKIFIYKGKKQMLFFFFEKQ
jgi:hypothetical protein